MLQEAVTFQSSYNNLTAVCNVNTITWYTEYTMFLGEFKEGMAEDIFQQHSSDSSLTYNL